MSLSDYLLREIAQVAERPTLEEMVERLAQRRPIEPDVSSADIIRAGRDRP